MLSEAQLRAIQASGSKLPPGLTPPPETPPPLKWSTMQPGRRDGGPDAAAFKRPRPPEARAAQLAKKAKIAEVAVNPFVKYYFEERLDEFVEQMEKTYSPEVVDGRMLLRRRSNGHTFDGFYVRHVRLHVPRWFGGTPWGVPHTIAGRPFAACSGVTHNN